jgi:glucosamine--fructose-6-phosphate aminotransferase (isomerizing)
MCGICGYIGYNNSFDYCYYGIIRLFNRGNDSIGISTLNSNNDIITHKFSNNNTPSFEKQLLKHKHEHDGTLSISHSRWKVVGKGNNINSHPHVDMYNTISLVHNGIIENYLDLKKFLLQQNFTFKSETDTEIIVNLISYYYNILKCSFIESITKTTSLLEGSYALVILLSEKQHLYCIRNGSPLLIGFDENTTFSMVSSEKYGFHKNINKYISADNHDLIILSKKNNIINMESCKNIPYSFYFFRAELNDYTLPSTYTHWTLKEIHEQPDTSLNLINKHLFNDSVEFKELDFLFNNNKIKNLNNINNIIFLGCGTSLNAGLYAEYIFKQMRFFNIVKAMDASEFTVYDKPIEGNTCYVFLTQSGETKNLQMCLPLCNDDNDIKLGIINIVDSLIDREMDATIYLNCNREISVASTKSFTNQMIALLLLLLWFYKKYNIPFDSTNEFIIKLKKLPNDIQKTIDENNETCKLIAYYLHDKHNAFVLGKNKYFPIAKEASLKIIELCYLHCEGVSSSALKHGMYTLITKNLPIFLFLPNDHNLKKNMIIYNELISRNTDIICITDMENDEIINEKLFKINIFQNSFFEILSIVNFQLICYHCGLLKKITMDLPRNLAKTVTID